jgi:hypothetical protein
MKTITDIDQEYSDYLGEEINSINEFSGDFFVELDHESMFIKVDVQIMGGRLLKLKLSDELEKQIIKEAYKKYEANND